MSWRYWSSGGDVRHWFMSKDRNGPTACGVNAYGPEDGGKDTGTRQFCGKCRDALRANEAKRLSLRYRGPTRGPSLRVYALSAAVWVGAAVAHVWGPV